MHNFIVNKKIHGSKKNISGKAGHIYQFNLTWS